MKDETAVSLSFILHFNPNCYAISSLLLKGITGLEKQVKRKVIMAKEVGFCFGVKRAINLTRQALAERGDVFILGDLVHNKRVTDELEGKGLRKVEDYEAEKAGTMVIRAHGLP